MPTNPKKPVDQLQRLTRLLGWRFRLQLHQHRIHENDGASGHRGKILTWYEAGVATGGRQDCFLQINESPQGQTVTYTGAVYAIRYRICSGWHEFRLFSSDDDLQREAARLAPWLAWDWFATIEKRRAYRLAHPECAGKSWRTIGESAGG